MLETDEAKTHKTVCYCHCDHYSEIPQEMVNNCAEAWREHLTKNSENGTSKMPRAKDVVPSEERSKYLAEFRQNSMIREKSFMSLMQ